MLLCLHGQVFASLRALASAQVPIGGIFQGLLFHYALSEEVRAISRYTDVIRLAWGFLKRGGEQSRFADGGMLSLRKEIALSQ